MLFLLSYRKWGCSMKGFSTGLPIGLGVAYAQTARERNWNYFTYKPHIKHETGHFGGTKWTEFNVSDGKRFADPGRRTVFGS